MRFSVLKSIGLQVCLAATIAARLSAGDAPPQPAPQPAQPQATPATPAPTPTPAPAKDPKTPTPAATPAPTPAPAPQPTLPQVPADIRDMTNPGYLIELANVHFRYGALDRAEPLLRAALEKGKDAAQKQQAYQTLGSVLQRKGDWKGVAEMYEAAVAGAANPSERGRMSIQLADAYIRSNEQDKAEKLILEIPPTTKDHPEDQWIQQTAFRLLTQIWQSKPGRVDAYITEAEATLAKTPDDPTTLDRLSEIYSNVKREPAKALPYLEKLSTLRPEDKGLQYRLASFYQQSRQFDKSIEVYKKMMAAPGARKEEIHAQSFQIGMLLQQSGKKDDAVAWIKDNYAKDIASPQDYSLLAMFYEQCDMKTEADAALTQLAEGVKTPNEKADAKIRIAELALRRREFTKADEIAQGVLKEFKDNPNAMTRANNVIKRVEAEAAAAKAAEAAKPVVPPQTPGQAPPTPPETKDAPKEAAVPAKDASTTTPPPEKK